MNAEGRKATEAGSDIGVGFATIGRYPAPDTRKILTALEKAGIPYGVAADEAAFHTKAETLEHIVGRRGGLSRRVSASVPIAPR